MNPTSAPTLADPEVFASPYAIYDRMREQGGVYLDPVLGLYVVVAAKELEEVLLNHEDYSSVPDTRVMAFYSNADDVMALYEKEGGYPPMSTLVTGRALIHCVTASKRRSWMVGKSSPRMPAC